MRAANPIYDVVFKFLPGDMRIAKLILSKILDQEIETLEFKPTEFRKKIGLNLTVFRIDFSAVILQEDGSRRLVLIILDELKSLERTVLQREKALEEKDAALAKALPSPCRFRDDRS